MDKSYIDRGTITDVEVRADGMKEITYKYDRQLIPGSPEAALYQQAPSGMFPDSARVNADLAKGIATTATLIHTAIISPSTEIAPEVTIEPGETVWIKHEGGSKAIKEIRK